jgi:hypothetical protein
MPSRRQQVDGEADLLAVGHDCSSGVGRRRR